MSKRPRIQCLSLLLIAFSAGACAPANEDNNPTIREVLFDGAEVRAELGENPDAVFFVDTRDGIINHFDESEEPLDYSKFIFQCPSMANPVPMEWIIEVIMSDNSDHGLVNVVGSDYWTIQSQSAVDDSLPPDFRSLCYTRCPTPGDCFEICVDKPSKPPQSQF